MSVGAAQIAVLEADPDLAEGLSGEALELATRKGVARVRMFAPGSPIEASEFDPVGHLGLLILDGLLARRVTIGKRTCAELLGPGDILRPWLVPGPHDSVLQEVDWSIVSDLKVASLDAEFAARMCQWPQIVAHIGDRIMMRARSLAFHLAVCHMVRVEERLLLVLWHLADRWGRVTPDGVVLPVRLTHRLLAAVVGARRPSVTKAVGELEDKGLVRRGEDGTWLLLGRPPQSFEQIRRETTAPIDVGTAERDAEVRT